MHAGEVAWRHDPMANWCPCPNSPSDALAQLEQGLLSAHPSVHGRHARIHAHDLSHAVLLVRMGALLHHHPTAVSIISRLRVKNRQQHVAVALVPDIKCQQTLAPTLA